MREVRVIRLLVTLLDWVPVPTQRWQDMPQAVDSKGTNRDVPETVSERLRRDEAELARLKRMDMIRAGDEDGRDDPVLEAHAAHLRSGSYDDVDQALAELRHSDTVLHWLLVRSFVDPVPVRRHELDVSIAIARLNQMLPPPLRVPGDDPRRLDMAERNHWIRMLSLEGYTGARIARRMGVSEPTVSRALLRRCCWVSFESGGRYDVCGRLAQHEVRGGLHVCIARHLDQVPPSRLVTPSSPQTAAA